MTNSARRQERECYENGIAMYERVATLPAFRDGLARLRSGAAKYRLAILCAEKEPLVCHRAILIARCLKEAGTPVAHILAGGDLETMRLPSGVWFENWTSGGTLFEPDLTESELIARAYSQRGREIAYHEDHEGLPP